MKMRLKIFWIFPCLLISFVHGESHYPYNALNMGKDPYVLKSGEPYRDILTVKASKTVAEFARRFQPLKEFVAQKDKDRQGQAYRSPPNFIDREVGIVKGNLQEDDEIFDFTDSRFINPPPDSVQNFPLVEDSDPVIIIPENIQHSYNNIPSFAPDFPTYNIPQQQPYNTQQQLQQQQDYNTPQQLQQQDYNAEQQLQQDYNQQYQPFVQLGSSYPTQSLIIQPPYPTQPPYPSHPPTHQPLYPTPPTPQPSYPTQPSPKPQPFSTIHDTYPEYPTLPYSSSHITDDHPSLFSSFPTSSPYSGHLIDRQTQEAAYSRYLLDKQTQEGSNNNIVTVLADNRQQDNFSLSISQGQARSYYRTVVGKK